MRVIAAAVEITARQYVNAAYIGIGHNRPIDLRQFKAFFRLCPLGVARLWYALEETCSGCVYSDGVGPVFNFTSVQIDHLLLCLHFMKTYSSASCGASLFRMTEKTHRKYFWAMISYLNHLGNCTVSNICIRITLIVRSLLICFIPYVPFYTGSYGKSVHEQQRL